MALDWHRCEVKPSAGIVAVTAWMLSGPRQVNPYLRAYASCNWDSVACHPPVANLWFPRLAKTLALRVLEELAREVEERPRPIVFSTFSGGVKACLYQMFRILQGSSGQEAGNFDKVRACVAGQIHDSSPHDFVSKVGARFVSHSFMPGFGEPPIPIYWLARTGGWVTDVMFCSMIKQQRRDYWSALHSSAALGPLLLLCSKSDALVPLETVTKFAVRMQELGCTVTLVAWDDSSHVAHLRQYPAEYIAAVAKFLQDAASSKLPPLPPQQQQSVVSLPAAESLLQSKL